MPTTASERAAEPKGESRQEAQRRLVTEAEKRAGVAEAMEVYGRLARYDATVRHDQSAIRHATGANHARTT